VLVLLEPAGESIEDSEDAKLLLKCCCSDDGYVVDDNFNSGSCMGNIMSQLNEDGNSNVASAMPELVRRCAASGLISGGQTRPSLCDLHEGRSLGQMPNVARKFLCSSFALSLRFFMISRLLRRPTARLWRPGMAGRGHSTASSRGDLAVSLAAPFHSLIIHLTLVTGRAIKHKTQSLKVGFAVDFGFPDRRLDESFKPVAQKVCPLLRPACLPASQPAWQIFSNACFSLIISAYCLSACLPARPPARLSCSSGATKQAPRL
jgi:hypothetical protein